MQSTSAVIELWPSDDDFAADLGVSVGLVRVWRHRQSVPPEYWAAVETAAALRGIKGATAGDLAKAAAARRKRPAVPTDKDAA